MNTTRKISQIKEDSNMKYIAYGSNMVEEQMAFRCPNARLLGTGWLLNHRLEFYLHATVEKTRSKGARVPVAVWEIDEADEHSLDRYDGVPNYYVKRQAQVQIIQRLYEDNIEGRISDERFTRMTASYETEQQGLETRVAELREALNSAQDQQGSIDRFLALVRKYTDIQELTAEVLREFVEKVYVHQTERVDGQKVQRIRIVYNCIGEFAT
jgi:hypothetical protein